MIDSIDGRVGGWFWPAELSIVFGALRIAKCKQFMTNDISMKYDTRNGTPAMLINGVEAV